jgi:hypothetical protein
VKTLPVMLLILAACDCRPSVVVAPAPAPIVAGDGGDVCGRAIASAAQCSCPWATPAAADACRRDQAQGNASQLAPACLAAAGDCGALKACAGAGGCP